MVESGSVYVQEDPVLTAAICAPVAFYAILKAREQAPMGDVRKPENQSRFTWRLPLSYRMQRTY